jgi:hypothetical protein
VISSPSSVETFLDLVEEIGGRATEALFLVCLARSELTARLSNWPVTIRAAATGLQREGQ